MHTGPVDCDFYSGAHYTVQTCSRQVKQHILSPLAPQNSNVASRKVTASQLQSQSRTALSLFTTNDRHIRVIEQLSSDSTMRGGCTQQAPRWGCVVGTNLCVVANMPEGRYTNLWVATVRPRLLVVESGD